MKCPKCDEGTIKRIFFKKSEIYAYWCEFCDALWFEGEPINIMTNHTLSSYSQDQDLEYTIEEISEKGQDYEPIQKVVKL